MASTSKIVGLMALAFVLACSPPPADSTQPVAAADPLPSWNDCEAKQRILEFVVRRFR